MGWAQTEFGTIDLGDKRLDRRLMLLAERLADKPTASIPDACKGRAETQAAYRFLSQEDVTWHAILNLRVRSSFDAGAFRGVAQLRIVADPVLRL